MHSSSSCWSIWASVDYDAAVLRHSTHERKFPVRVVNFSFCWSNNNVIKRWRRLPYAFFRYILYCGCCCRHVQHQSFRKCFYYSNTKELVSAGAVDHHRRPVGRLWPAAKGKSLSLFLNPAPLGPNMTPISVSLFQSIIKPSIHVFLPSFFFILFPFFFVFLMMSPCRRSLFLSRSLALPSRAHLLISSSKVSL